MSSIYGVNNGTGIKSDLYYGYFWLKESADVPMDKIRVLSQARF
ncbi:MAG: hypothetical protein OQK73_07280 [Gammaproteobacteria bacterium]|nr:hypothetical protein [Gammaproteobacteria bacterium]